MSQETLPCVAPEIGVNPRDSWCTPEWVWQIPLEAMGLSEYDLDPCSNEWSTVPAIGYVQPPNDGLSYWDGLLGHVGLLTWLNPPYSDVAPWFERASIAAWDGWVIFGVVPHAPGITAWGDNGPDIAWSLGRVRFIPPPGIPESSPTQEHDLVCWWRDPDPEMIDEIDRHPKTLYRMDRLRRE